MPTLKGFDQLPNAMAAFDHKPVTESAVKDAVKKRLREIGAYQHWPVQTGIGAPCLDCHGCYNGQYFAIETKRPGKVPTPRQETTMAQIRAAGGWVFVIDSVETAQKLFL